MDDDDDVITPTSSYDKSRPIGVLTIQIIGCSNLKIGDVISSDPFVEVKYLNTTYKTSVIYKNLNPNWLNSYFNLIIYESMTNIDIELVVFDYDEFKPADYLGSSGIHLEIKDLIKFLNNPNEENIFEKELTNGENGKIKYGLNYVPLCVRQGLRNASIDVIYNLTSEILSNDIVNNVNNNLSKATTTTPSSVLNNLNMFTPPNEPKVIGVILITNLILSLAPINSDNYDPTDNHSNSNHVQLPTSPTSNSHTHGNSFSITFEYNNVKTSTSTEKCFSQKNNYDEIHFEGIYSFIITNNNNNNNEIVKTDHNSSTSDTNSNPDFISLKIKMNSKTSSEIFLTLSNIQNFMNSNKIRNENVKKKISIGNMYDGNVTFKIEHIPKRKMS